MVTNPRISEVVCNEDDVDEEEEKELEPVGNPLDIERPQ